MYLYIFYRCSQVNDELKKVGKACVRLLYEIPENSTFRKDLKWLNYLYDSDNCQLSAADVFVLNRINFFGLIGSSASWVVILVQMVIQQQK